MPLLRRLFPNFTWENWRESTLNTFFPERRFVGTPWLGEWKEAQRNSTLKTTVICSLLAGILWLAHYVLFDLPMNLQPSSWWLKLRVIVFLWSMACMGLALWPKLRSSKFYWAPMAVNGWVFCMAEALAATRADIVPYIYPVLFVLLAMIPVQANLFWSLVYVAVTSASQMPLLMIAYPDRMTEVMSGLTVCFLGTAFYRARVSDEIRSFINIRQLAAAKQKILVQELELTGAVQKLLLPEKDSIHDRKFALAAKFQPAAESGGDWWWFSHENNKLRIIVGDVAGHGAGPAMVTATVTSMVRSLYNPQQPFGEFIAEIQKRYLTFFERSQYWMTLTAAEFDFSTMRLKCWFAGGPPIVRVEKSGESKIISELGSPFGADDNLLGEVSCEMSSTDRFVFMSDGIYEERHEKSGTSLDLRRICRMLQRLKETKDVGVAASEILASVVQERGTLKQGDDYTLVMVDLKAS